MDIRGCCCGSGGGGGQESGKSCLRKEYFTWSLNHEYEITIEGRWVQNISERSSIK